jgi:predicted dehydrogenase
MLRIGLISAATYGYMGAPRTPGSNHGTAFATSFNDWDEAKVKAHQWTFVRSKRKLDGALVVRVWDPQRDWAQRLADACGIEKVCATPEEVSQDVDAVLIVDDGSGEQWRYAEPSLKRGVPTFCDKPLAMTAKQAQAVVQLARKEGTKFMSASSLRFVPDIQALCRDLPELGNVSLATVACANELVYYGIHALSMAYAVLGPGAVSCINVGTPDVNVVRVRFQTGRDVLLMVGDRTKMAGSYQISVYGQKNWRVVKPDLANLYSYLLEAFLQYLRTGQEPYPLEDEVELIAALEAGKRSLAEKREVTIAEILA